MKTMEIDLKTEVAITRIEVMQVTGMTEEAISHLLFEGAEQWLEFIGCGEAIALSFQSTPEFWGSWKKAWYDADKDFLRHYHYHQYDRFNAIQWYNYFHDVKGAFINTDRVQADFHSIIKRLTVKK